MAKSPPPRFVIVQHLPDRRPWIWLVCVLAWAMSLYGVSHWASERAAPRLVATRAELGSIRGQLTQSLAEVRELRQRRATLARSDEISRAANLKVQQTLAEREQQIAVLRADTAFYERLGGATRKPRGLNVHSARFEPETGGSWRYLIVLTQSLDRGAVSLGQLRFQVEGVRGGQLATVDWDQLHQRAGAPAQDYSFRYFQQLDGSVMLPPGFTPQRVRVSLRSNGATVDQTLGWGQHVSQARAVPPATATRDT